MAIISTTLWAGSVADRIVVVQTRRRHWVMENKQGLLSGLLVQMAGSRSSAEWRRLMMREFLEEGGTVGMLLPSKFESIHCDHDSKTFI